VQACHSRVSRGFTLIEILVVCVIVAVMLGLAALRLEQSSETRLNGAAEDLARQLEAARDESVIRGLPIAFSSDGHAYQFWLSVSDSNEWIVLPDIGQHASSELPDGIVIDSMQINGRSRPLGERLVFSSSGLSESFILALSSDSVKIEIVADALGHMDVRHAQ